MEDAYLKRMRVNEKFIQHHHPIMTGKGRFLLFSGLNEKIKLRITCVLQMV